MSVHFGRWNFAGQPAPPGYLEKVNTTIAPYGPDAGGMHSEDGINVIYRAFHTTQESHREVQPQVCSCGAVVAWDGRLDNRDALIREVGRDLSATSTDVEIVASAYEMWGATCFGKFIGDWALSIWNPRDRCLLLATDAIGIRHLYYSVDEHEVTWCTILDPLTLCRSKPLRISEEYVANWFAIKFPDVHLTPYAGIQAVPPSSFVLLRADYHVVTRYWDFDPDKVLRYRSDSEYDEHFRSVFRTAIKRNLRSDRPILAELSGGLDSAAIVCVADEVIGRGNSDTHGVDTVSWYDNSNPAEDELPYVMKVEARRGRRGWHVDLREVREENARCTESKKSFASVCGSELFTATLSDHDYRDAFFEHYRELLKAQDYRVTLCGIGGGEFLGGGVPTPTPELQNLLARGRILQFIHQLIAWSRRMKRSPLRLLHAVVRGFFPYSFSRLPRHMSSPLWFHPDFIRRNCDALCGRSWRVKLLGPLPSFQTNLHELDAMRRVLTDFGPLPDMLREVRFPFLDRDLLEFLFAIPREQLVHVGQRRFLLKRALAGIVPAEILQRRKAPYLPVPRAVSKKWTRLIDEADDLVSASTGIVDAHQFKNALVRAERNEDVSVDILDNTLALESWLRHLQHHGVLAPLASRQSAMLSRTHEAVCIETSTPPRGFGQLAAGNQAQEERR